jgi:RNA polymerase sigma factor (sigma-70 family)
MIAIEDLSNAFPIKVAVIDDDESARRSLARLLKSVPMQATAFASAREFLANPAREEMDCVVSDVRMPGVDGFKLLEALVETVPYSSLVLISGYGDVSMAVKAMKGGAVDFLEKPVDRKALLAAIRRAAQRSRELRTAGHELEVLKRDYESLTPRQRDVFALVVAGLLNKQVGAQLGISEKTVKVHRGRIMERMGAESLADLVRMATRLGIRPEVADYAGARGRRAPA